MDKSEIIKNDEITSELIENLKNLESKVRSYKENGENLEKVSNYLENIVELIQSFSETNDSFKALSTQVIKNDETVIETLEQYDEKVMKLYKVQKRFSFCLMIIILVILGINIYSIIKFGLLP